MQIAIPVAPDIITAFNTPLLVRRRADGEGVHGALATAIRALRSGAGGGGAGAHWRSPPDLWQAPGEAFARYREWVYDAVLSMSALASDDARPQEIDVRYRVRCWADIMRDGGYLPKHSLGAIDWTVIYVLERGPETPGHAANGRIELFDPRIMAASDDRRRFGFGAGLMLDAAPGTLTMFPGWVEFWMHPYHGPGERIFIIANIDITGGRHAGRG
jgi:hypothetical protein